MKRRFGGLLLLLGSAMFVACDDTGGGGAVGGGSGAAATGGAGGNSGLAGSGGAGTADASSTPTDAINEPSANAPDCFPACIARLREACRRPTTGTCVHGGSSGRDNYCYSNGVKESVQTFPFVTSKQVAFFTPAGALCYSTEVLSPPGSPVLDIAFRDAAGKEVARGKVGFAAFRWEITCDGQTFMVNELDDACDEVGPGNCTQGTSGSCP